VGYFVFRDFEEENITSVGTDCCILDNPHESIKDYVHCEDLKGNLPADSSMVSFNLKQSSENLYFSFFLDILQIWVQYRWIHWIGVWVAW